MLASLVLLGILFPICEKLFAMDSDPKKRRMDV